MDLLRFLSGCRHGLGFGVHSPLAYDLITTTLRDRPRYYADNDIERLYDSRRRRRVGRIAFRLTARFKPATVYDEAGLRDSILLADNNIVFVDREEVADMSASTDGCYTVFIIGHPDEGVGPVTLDNFRDMRIVIFRRGLSQTNINVRF
ncbi:MAG: hypothetical protein J1F20_05375 [Muribaculaceae bacterium]|nr:hypothetical protein [Muribaculaceae bacterium]